MTALVLTPASCTNSGNNTASASWGISRPAQSTGDMIVCHLVSDAAVTHGTLPGGPNGETAVTIIASQRDAANGVGVSVWYWIATAASASGTVTVTPSASEQWTATVVRIPYLQYDSATPVQYSNNYLAGSSAAIVSPTLVPSRNRQRPVFWAGIDADTVTGISQQAGTTWTLMANVDRGAVTGVFAYRENQTSLSATVTSGNLTGASDNYVSVGYLINEVAAIALSPTKASLTLTGYVPTIAQTTSNAVAVSWAEFQTPYVAPTSQTLEPVKGALTLTGHIPVLTQTANRSLTPTDGSLTLTGYLPAVSQTAHQSLEPTKAGLTLTGQQPTVAQTAHRSLEPAKGSLSLAGYVPGVTRTDHRSLEPAKGTLTLTGGTATVAQTAGVTIAAIVGHLTATGYAPGLVRTAHQIIGPPTTGTLTLTGQQATVSRSGNASLEPTPGHLTLTGYAPALAQTGDYVAVSWAEFQTPAVEVLTPVVINPAKGALTLTGKVPTVGNQAALIEWDDITGEDGFRVKWGLASDTYSWSADVSADDTDYEIQSLTYGTKYYVRIYGLVGGVEQDPSDEIMLTAGFGFQPITGHLTLTGRVPTVSQGAAQSATPTTGHLTLTGYVPTVARIDHRSLEPATGHLSLSGYVPTITQSRVVEPSGGHLLLTGYAPSLTQLRSLEPLVGHLALTGRIPILAQTGDTISVSWAEFQTPYVAPLVPVEVTPATGHLTLTGYVPTIAQTTHNAVEPLTGHLGLRGYVPTVSGYVVVVPPPSKPGAGGVGRGGKKPKRKVWVEPEDDGPEIEVETPADVPRAVKAVKRQAKAIAERAIRAREPIPELPQWVVHGDAPHAEDLRQRIEAIRANFAYVYQLMLIEQHRRDDEANEAEDEDILLLTL